MVPAKKSSVSRPFCSAPGAPSAAASPKVPAAMCSTLLRPGMVTTWCSGSKHLLGKKVCSSSSGLVRPLTACVAPQCVSTMLRRMLSGMRPFG